MVINVGVNGFGRVGRVVSRACLQNSGLQVNFDDSVGHSYCRFYVRIKVFCVFTKFYLLAATYLYG